MSATVPVAEHPSPGAATYGQIRASASNVSLAGAFIDDLTPPGHFGIVLRNIGGVDAELTGVIPFRVQTYHFQGSFGDLNAPVVARTQHAGGRSFHYIGGSVLGGSLVPTSRMAAA